MEEEGSGRGSVERASIYIYIYMYVCTYIPSLTTHPRGINEILYCTAAVHKGGIVLSMDHSDDFSQPRINFHGRQSLSLSLAPGTVRHTN
jgi:hypothetical protein